MSSEGERLIELMTEVGQRLGTAFGDMVPDAAQRHLLNAQRELLTALFLIYEHQMGARRRSRHERDRDGGGEDDGWGEAGHGDAGEEPERPAPRRRPRVDRIDLE
jgi:hypothetical protein